MESSDMCNYSHLVSYFLTNNRDTYALPVVSYSLLTFFPDILATPSEGKYPLYVATHGAEIHALTIPANA